MYDNNALMIDLIRKGLLKSRNEKENCTFRNALSCYEIIILRILIKVM